jgi:hypothetical protein
MAGGHRQGENLIYPEAGLRHQRDPEQERDAKQDKQGEFRARPHV